MVKAPEREAPFWDSCVLQVLVVVRDRHFGRRLVNELRNRSIRAKHTETVDAFLDLNCRERIDLVSLEIDAMDPNTLDNIKLLRTHFGEGPGTRIVASSSVKLDTLSVLAEQRGADTFVTKYPEPETMAVILEAELRRSTASNNIGSSSQARLQNEKGRKNGS